MQSRPWTIRVLAVCVMLALAGIIAALAAGEPHWPGAGDTVKREGSLTLDVSHMDQGYIMAKADSSSKLKLRITKGDMTYTYDLNKEGNYEVFPLQMGSGSYKVSLYKNVKSNKYSKDSEISVKASLADENAAFLVPSQYVYYTSEMEAVAKSFEVCEGLETDREKVEAIREFMRTGFVYDYVRALTTPGSYLGDVEGCYGTRMGLCQDLSVVAACMLRVQGIPTQLVIGYADDIYHAWNMVLVDGEYELLDITAELQGIRQGAEYTPERYY